MADIESAELEMGFQFLVNMNDLCLAANGLGIGAISGLFNPGLYPEMGIFSRLV